MSRLPHAAILDKVRRLPGVVRAEWLSDEERRELARLATPNAADNRGVREALARDRVLVLFKDRTFRPPPEPTILLVDDRGTVIGRELLPGESLPDDHPRKVVRLGKGFVLFADRGGGPGFRFLLPPVPFPELDVVEGVREVVSASPDPRQDEYLKARHGIAAGKEYASILVGLNVRNP